MFQSNAGSCWPPPKTAGKPSSYVDARNHRKPKIEPLQPPRPEATPQDQQHVYFAEGMQLASIAVPGQGPMTTRINPIMTTWICGFFSMRGKCLYTWFYWGIRIWPTHFILGWLPVEIIFILASSAPHLRSGTGRESCQSLYRCCKRCCILSFQSELPR